MKVKMLSFDTEHPLDKWVHVTLQLGIYNSGDCQNLMEFDCSGERSPERGY